jgi:hypothetical protein
MQARVHTQCSNLKSHYLVNAYDTYSQLPYEALYHSAVCLQVLCLCRYSLRDQLYGTAAQHSLVNALVLELSTT